MNQKKQEFQKFQENFKFVNTHHNTNRAPTRRNVLLMAKTYVHEMISPPPSRRTEELIKQAKLYGTFLKKHSKYYEITKGLHEIYTKTIDLLIRRYQNVIVPMINSEHDNSMRYVVEISALLKKFKAVYDRNIKKGKELSAEKVPNALKDVAKKFKIPLTKLVNNVRMTRTKKELQNEIWRKRRVSTYNL